MKVTERKSILAKLLAKENITVTQGTLKTAYFDVENRILGLPNWKDRGAAVYDMLIGHEVGHALYTPVEGVRQFRRKFPKVPFDVCNVVEDIRIERLIKAAYPGLPRLFNEAYAELVKADFFGIEGKDISKLSFIDRLNLQGKIGDFVEVPLSDSEREIYNKCFAAESFEDVLDICGEIVAKNESDEEESEESEEAEEAEDNAVDDSDDSEAEESEAEDNAVDDSDDSEAEESEAEESEAEESGDGDSEAEEDDDGEEAEGADEVSDDVDLDTSASSEDIKGDENADDTDAVESAVGDNGNSGKASSDDLTSETMKSFDENMEDDVELPKDLGYTPVMMPRNKCVKETIITPQELKASRSSWKKINAHIKRLSDLYKTEYDFEGFYSSKKKMTNKKVGVLVREFERRKAAYQYARAQESRSGVINVNQLHKYKLSDDIFLSKTVMADAKSHGMIFLLDYSGSMSGQIHDVNEQTINMVEFCKKVGIPFEVYSFTDHCYGKAKKNEPISREVRADDLVLIQHLSSDMSRSEYEEAIKYMWLNIWDGPGSSNSNLESLGGTPLNNALLAMHSIVKNFIDKHKVQKTHFVTLTDGDSRRLTIGNQYDHRTPKYHIKANNKTYEVHAGSNRQSTSQLLQIVKDIPTVNTIGFFLPSKDKKQMKNQLSTRAGYVSQMSTKFKKLFKSIEKDGFADLGDVNGYDTFIFLSGNVTVKDDEFEYSDDRDIASSRGAQTKLAREFVKHNGANKKSRVLMAKMAEVFA